MCTIGYHRDLGIVFKNRDKSSQLVEEIIRDEKIIACRTAGADYFSWGINVYGCAFVTSAINSPHWTKLIYDGDRAAADDVLRQENAGLTNPVTVVSSMLPDIQQVEPWVEALCADPQRALGYNILLADRGQAVLVEAYGVKRSIRPLQPKEAITNNFQTLDHGPKVPEDYPNSFRRYAYANRLLSGAISLTDVLNMLNPEDPQLRKQIWRSGPFITISASVLDLQNGKVYYAREIDNKYSVFNF